jgi:putative peptidoglycan lipid II flippase
MECKTEAPGLERDDYRATLIVMGGLAIANLTGFLREVVIADRLGAGRAADVFLIAFSIPEFIFVALPIVLSPAFIPLFAELRLRVGAMGALRFAYRVAWALVALLAGVTLLAAIGAPLYVRWLAPGFAPLEQAQARQAVYLMLPAISLMGVATLVGAILQVYRRFARPALATAAYNLAFVAALLVLPLAWPVGRAAWGVTLGALAALLIQLPMMGRLRLSSLTAIVRASGERLSTSVGHVARMAGPLAAAYAVHHVILLVDRAMASTLGAGSVAALNYGYRLALVVAQLSGLAVSTALFPHMAEQAANEDLSGLRASTAGALRFVWTFGLPASCGLIVFRVPLVRLLFEHGAFDEAATAAVSSVLTFYTVSVLADALCLALWRVLYAQRSTWVVLAVNGLQTAVRILCNIALIHNLGYNGLALSAAVGLSLQVVVLGQLVRRRLGPYLSKKWWRDAGLVVLATAAALTVVRVMAGQVSTLPALGALAISGTLGGLTYLLILQILRRWLAYT